MRLLTLGEAKDGLLKNNFSWSRGDVCSLSNLTADFLLRGKMSAAGLLGPAEKTRVLHSSPIFRDHVMGSDWSTSQGLLSRCDTFLLLHAFNTLCGHSYSTGRLLLQDFISILFNFASNLITVGYLKSFLPFLGESNTQQFILAYLDSVWKL